MLYTDYIDRLTMNTVVSGVEEEYEEEGGKE